MFVYVYLCETFALCHRLEVECVLGSLATDERGCDMIKKLISVGALLVAASGSYAEKISFSEYSELKSSAADVGKYLGVLEACENNKKLMEILKDPLMLGMMAATGWNPDDDPRTDDINKLVIDNMEATGLEFSMLSELDDIMRNARNEFSNKARTSLELEFENSSSFCISVLTQASVFLKDEVLPDDPIERMKTYAKISPFQ